MTRSWRSRLSIAIILGVLASTMTIPMMASVAADPDLSPTAQGYLRDCEDFRPTSGSFLATTTGSEFRITWNFRLNEAAKSALDCVANRFGQRWLELEAALTGFGGINDWDGYEVTGTNIPGAVHDSGWMDAAGDAAPGVTGIPVTALEKDTPYYFSIRWNTTSQFYPIAGQTQRVSFQWVPSHWADPFNALEWPACVVGLGLKAWCIFPGGTAYISGQYYDFFPAPDDGIPFGGPLSAPLPYPLIVGSTPPSEGGSPSSPSTPPSNPPPPPPNPLGPDFNRDGTADIYVFHKHDIGSGKTVYFVLDGKDPSRTLQIGATAFGWTDENWHFAPGGDWNGDSTPDIYAFNKRDAGSGKTVYFVLNGRDPAQFLQIGSTPFGWTDANWSFSPGPDFNHDGRPELYAFNKHDVGSGKTVHFVLDGRNPEHVLQVGGSPFGWTDANWSFSAGPDWNGDGTPEFYAFNKQDAGSGHTVYFVLNGRGPEQVLQIGALPFTWTSDDWSFAPIGDFNHDGRVDFYAFNRHDMGSGKTVVFILDGRDPARFLLIGATPYSWTNSEWSFGAGDNVRDTTVMFQAINRQDPGSGKTVFFKFINTAPDQFVQLGATPFGHTDAHWSFAPGPDFNSDGTPELYAFNKHDVGTSKTVSFVLNGRNPEQVLQIGVTPFGWTDANWSFSAGPDFNHDGTPDLYAFNRQDLGSGKTVHYVLNGRNPEHVLQVGGSPFGFTDANWSFSVGADFNHDGTPDFYAFNKHDVGSGKTVYFVLDGRGPERVLQVGATAFGWTDANYSFMPGPDFNRDGTADIYVFNRQDAGTGKTVFFVLNGKSPDQFLQIGATAFGFTDSNWDFGVVAN